MFSFESSFYVGYKPDTKGIQFFDPIVSSSPSPYNMTSTIGQYPYQISFDRHTRYV